MNVALIILYSSSSSIIALAVWFVRRRRNCQLLPDPFYIILSSCLFSVQVSFILRARASKSGAAIPIDLSIAAADAVYG